MHRSRLLVALGVVGAAASLALPFATLPGAGGIGGIQGAAWPVLLPLGPLLALFMVGDHVEAPRRPVAWIGAVLAAGGLAFAIVKTVDAWLAADRAAGAVGAGAWVLVVATLVAVLGTALGFSRRI